jgi:arsenate reductase-like glutaredoxin family protein
MLNQKTTLNKTQLEILKLFSKPLSEEELQDLKKVLVNHLSEKLIRKTEVITKEKGYKQEDFNNWLNDPGQ